MPGKTVKILSTLPAVAALAFAASVWAASGPTLYDIEVLVFENRQPGLEGGEVLRAQRQEATDTETAASPEGVPDPDSTLSLAAAELARSGQHRVLAHKRWQQNAAGKAETTPLRLQSPGQELDGTLRFYFSRFLHVELNLTLQEGAGGTAYQLAEHRRVRPQEVHYFDHPRLGALVRVTAVGKPEKPKPARKVKPSR
jgi:hypothetical protein